MAQLSYNTTTYDQLILRIRKFLIRYNNNEFSSYEEMANEYNNLLSDVNNYSGTQISKYDPYIKGEPATSSKFNVFAGDVSKDLNIISKQIDYQSGQIAATYNLFNTEIDKELEFVKRINSKISVLQMYSTSPANDIYYVGDSFDNFDYVDISKIQSNKIPFISEGNVKLPIRNSSKWVPNYIEIDTNNSNGFIGNNHIVYQTENINENSKYFFEDNDKTGYIPNIIDNNPLTIFDYESINIPKELRDRNQSKDFEFFYKKNSAYYSWADHNISEPLRLGIIITSSVSQKINSLKIVPNLGNSVNTYPEVKVTKVSAVDSLTGNEIVLSEEEFYIGSTIVPQTIESRKKYFYEQAEIFFPEVNTSKIKIYFEQSSSQDVTVKHLYWTPEKSSDPLFTEKRKFNPEGLYAQGYEAISYSYEAIVPDILQPNKFKLGNNETRTVNVSYTTPEIVENSYVVAFERSGVTNYYSGYNGGVFEEVIRQMSTTSSGSRIDQAWKYSTSADAQTAINTIQDKISRGVWSGSQFQNLRIITVPSSNKYSKKSSVTLNKKYELYAAKRWSISLRSIERIQQYLRTIMPSGV